MTSVPDPFRRVEVLDDLAFFRQEFHACLTARADELFELVEAVLCVPGPVRSLVDLALAPEHRRGHGALYDGINAGRSDVARLPMLVAGMPVPRAADGRIVLAVDVSNWLRPDTPTSPERLFCHVYGRGKGNAQMISGWPYSVIAALEAGRISWTAVLDTVCLDACYDIPRLAFVLADLPVEVLGRLRSDRVFCFPAQVKPAGSLGRPPVHGATFALADASTQPEPAVATVTETTRYGTATATSWDRLHPRLTHRTCWLDHDGPLPIIEGTIVRLQVDHLPGDRNPRPVWLWASMIEATSADVDRWWQSYLRRLDLEHMFRMWKQTLGWTAPKIRTPQAADRWTWLIITAHTQLRLARHLVDDLRHPWEKRAAPGRLTPARIRRGFRNIRPMLPRLSPTCRCWCLSPARPTWPDSLPNATGRERATRRWPSVWPPQPARPVSATRGLGRARIRPVVPALRPLPALPRPPCRRHRGQAARHRPQSQQAHQP